MEYTMQIVRELQEYPSTIGLDNLYNEPLKAKNLDIYLTTISKLSPEAILVGDSPIYMGSRQTGIPFTDEYKVGNKEITLLRQKDKQGYSIMNDTEQELKREYSSAVVWKGLEKELENMVLWNIMPFYVHEKEYSVIRKNISPQEEEDGFHFFKQILKEIPSIRLILVSGDLVSRIMMNHPELKEKYDIYYISNPNIVSAPEFISRVKKALELKADISQNGKNRLEQRVVYEYRRRWADTDEEGNYYCRALNKILSPEMSKYCFCCPCNLYEKLYCGYYDFERKDEGWDLEKVKQRYDLLIQANLIPLFPDYKIRLRNNRVLVEQAFQFLAVVYRDRVSMSTNTPYLFYLMDLAVKFKPYFEKMESEHTEEIYIAILFHNILNNTKVPSGRIGKEFGEYIRSLVDAEAEEHNENIEAVLKLLQEAGATTELLDLFQKLLK